MKQISARVFRATFPKLTEPFTVSTRGEGGIIRILGTWTPSGSVPAPRVTIGPETFAHEATFTPVPKPSKRR